MNQTAEETDLVILFPNLIEDRALANPDLPAKELSKLVEYCLFPVKGIYQIEKGEKTPRSTLERPRFSDDDKGNFQVGRRIFLLVRGDEYVIADILNEFAEFGLANDIFLRFSAREQFEIKGVKNQFITLLTFKVFEGQSKSPNGLND